MNGKPIDSYVLRLADEAGVLTGWVDAWGNDQLVAEDDLLAVLEALTGRALDSTASVADALGDLIDDKPAVEPVIVAWDGSFPDTPIPFAVATASMVLEDGTEIPMLADERKVGIDVILPVGYHTLVINGGETVSHVFSAPMAAAPSPRDALGLIVPTYSLRSRHDDGGIGTLLELRQLADVCNDVGVQVIGTLPLLSAFPDQPSPYAPASRRAWNEIFVDFSRIPDWEGAPPAGTGESRWVDYDTVGNAVRDKLAGYAQHVSESPRLRSQVDDFLRHEPEMGGYARFMATADDHGRNWRAWESSPTPDPNRVAYHETVQWLMHTQLSEMSAVLGDRGQYLYLDLPIGCHADGYDIWSDPDLFAAASLGAPPDPLFVGGQDWGLPATVPSVARLDGHANFRKAIAKQLSVAGLLRIDHVMGILRTWWVPHGSHARQGAYVMHAADEMFAIICIESVRAQAGVVGENLGTVPPEIRQGLADHALLGMAGSHDAVSEPTSNDLVAISTHDTPSFSAWWAGNDIDDLADLGVFDQERARRERVERLKSVAQLQERFDTLGVDATRDAVMEWMAGTDAAVALMSLDDLILEDRRQNVPGTFTERPNWRLRHDRTVLELGADEDFTESVAGLAAIRARADSAS